jgi:hypothetical protein
MEELELELEREGMDAELDDIEENEEDTSREHYHDLEEAQTGNCAI